MKTLRLFELSKEKLRKMILKWQPTRDSFVDIAIVYYYLQRLPKTLLDGLFSASILNYQYWDGKQENYLQAGHVIVFVTEGQKQLKINYESDEFEFQLLLDVCGYKLKDIEELQLPFYSNLSAELCIRMCRLTPNLKKLILCAVNVSNDAMVCLKSLHLEFLDVSCTAISDNGLLKLCSGNSNIKHTLRFLKVADSNVTIFGCAQILELMPQIEDLDADSNWLTAIPFEVMQLSAFNIQKLRFHTSNKIVEDHLGIALKVCQNVRRIYLTTNIFTLKIYSLLSQFTKLNCLKLECLKSDRLRIGSYRSSVLSSLHGLQFPCLKELSLRNIDEDWFKRGHFIALINACSVLRKLKIKDSDGFNNKIGSVTKHKTLREFYVENCNKLNPQSVYELLHIKSLTNCQIIFLNRNIKNQYSDVKLEMLSTFAKEKNIHLEIIFEDLKFELLE